MQAQSIERHRRSRIITQCVLGIVLAAAAIAFLIMPLVRGTQCMVIRGDWATASGLVPADHVVVTVNGQTERDEMVTRNVPPQPQRIAEATARYQQNGCTGSISDLPR
jgi:hypothetical protein